MQQAPAYTLRSIPERNLFVEQIGTGSFRINGQYATFFSASEIEANPAHFLTKVMRAARAALPGVNIEGLVHGRLPEAKDHIQVLITAEHWAAGEEARKAFAAVDRACQAEKAKTERQEREYDRINNDGACGYNPYRVGDAPTYGRRSGPVVAHEADHD